MYTNQEHYQINLTPDIDFTDQPGVQWDVQLVKLKKAFVDCDNIRLIANWVWCDTWCIVSGTNFV